MPLGEADDEAAVREDALYSGHMPAPRVKATGILAEVARGNLTLHDLYAIESSEDFIAAEEFDSEAEGREESALGEGDGNDSDSGSEESDSGSGTPFSARKAAQRKMGKSSATLFPFLHSLFTALSSLFRQSPRTHPSSGQDSCCEGR